MFQLVGICLCGEVFLGTSMKREMLADFKKPNDRRCTQNAIPCGINFPTLEPCRLSAG
jgi:hypothetical protein